MHADVIQDRLSFGSVAMRIYDPGHPAAGGVPRVVHFDADGRTWSLDNVPVGAIAEPTLVMPDEFARALYDALHLHYRGADDNARALRAELDLAHARTDALIDHLGQVTRQLAAAV